MIYNKDRNKLINFKNIQVKEAQVNEATRTVSGYLAAFNNIDHDQDIIMKGAFIRSLTEHGVDAESPQKIIFLYMHRFDEPLGQFKVLEEDDTGLYFEAEVDEIEAGDRVLKQYSTGTLNQHSIGFNYVWEKCNWEKVGDAEAFVCNELKLFEGSVVSIGANENTPFTGFKNLENNNISETFRKEIHAAMKLNNQLAVSLVVEKYAPMFDNINTMIKEQKRAFNIDNAIKQTNFKFI